MNVTAQQIKLIAPATAAAALDTFPPIINKYAERFGVTTKLRMAAFLAQVLHESGCFRWLHELASGKEYEGRKDLGNVHEGDGERYKGRGLIQLTGRANYAQASKELFGDESILLDNPDKAAEPDTAVLVAYWFWQKRHLNLLADKGDTTGITRAINGGTNGLSERKLYYEAAINVLN